MKKQNLIGQRFGKLVVIKEIEPYIYSNKKRTKYLCKCDCGTETEVLAQSLKSGATKSCGCLQKEIAKKIGYDNMKILAEKQKTKYIGKRFGRLVVEEELQKRDISNGSVIYKCKCDCGNVIEVPSKRLTDGTTRSCGCLVSEFAKNNIKKLDLPHMTCYKNTKISTLSNTLSKSNSTGVRGCYFNNKKQKYIVRITIQGKTIYVGTFQSIEDARKARGLAEEKYWNPIKEEYQIINNKLNNEGNKII